MSLAADPCWRQSWFFYLRQVTNLWALFLFPSYSLSTRGYELSFRGRPAPAILHIIIIIIMQQQQQPSYTAGGNSSVAPTSR